MPDLEDPWRHIVEFIESRGYNDFMGMKRHLTRETELVRDLKITGDDAVEFMDSFIECFLLEIEDFNFHDHFDEEGLWLLPRLKKTNVKRKITLGMLERAVERGVWNSSQLNASADNAGT